MLANILLGLIILAGMIYGMYLMSGLDHFMTEERRLQDRREPQVSEEPESFRAVIFGHGKTQEKVGELLEERGLNPIYMEELCLKKEWNNVKCVVALSEMDEDNLSVCNLMHRMYHTEYLFSICNEKVNESVYKRFQVRLIENSRIIEDLDTFLRGNEVSIA